MVKILKNSIREKDVTKNMIRKEELVNLVRDYSNEGIGYLNVQEFDKLLMDINSISKWDPMMLYLLFMGNCESEINKKSIRNVRHVANNLP